MPKRQGPHRPFSAPTFRNFQLIRFFLSGFKGFLPLFSNLTRRYGDLIHFRFSHTHLILINHPDYIKYVLQSNAVNYRRDKAIEDLRPLLGQGLFMSEGDHWQRHRTLMQPAFDRQHFEEYARIVTRTTTDRFGRWTQHARRQSPLNIEHEMRHLSLDILFRMMFSPNAIVNLTEIDRSLNVILNYVSEKNYTPRLAWHVFTQVTRLRRTKNSPVQQAVKTLDHVVSQIMDACRHHGKQPGRLLGIFLEAYERQAISEQEIRDELMNILFAGYETVATALTWTCYALAKHLPIEKNVYDECYGVLTGRLPAMEDLERMPYIHKVIHESLRMYPPVWAFHRIANAPDELAGHPVPADASVMICPYTLHRHPDFWHDPDAFQPDRFPSSSIPADMRHWFIPFGAGLHTCIGKNLAMLEMPLILTTIIQKYRMTLPAKYNVKPTARIMLRPRKPLHVMLEVK